MSTLQISVWFALVFKTMSTIRSELQKKAQSAVVQYAFFRWESAVVIAGAILLTSFYPHPLPWWPLWGWPLLGLVGVIIIIITSLTDEETNAKVLQTLYQERFDPSKIKDKNLREDIKSALEYQKSIEAQVRNQKAGPMRTRLENAANQLSDWVKSIYKLALRLDAYRKDTLLAKERKSLPGEIKELTTRRKAEADPEVVTEFDEVLASKEKQQQILEKLNRRMKQAALQMEQSLTALATVYSQIQLIGVQALDSGRSERLQADIQEQVEQLNDLIGSINEVYDLNTEWLPTDL